MRSPTRAEGAGTTGDLLYCVSQANADPNPDGTEIEFDPSVFSASGPPQTITLSSTLVLTDTAGPEVIEGPGAGIVTISGGGAVRDFEVATGVTATLSALTISGGYSSYDGGGIAVDAGATLTVADSMVVSNTSSLDGGGIVDESTLIIENGSVISGNSASDDGGGVFVTSAGTATINVSKSSITNNTAGIDGGGLDDFQLVSSDVLTIDDSVISGNKGLGNTYGGGLTLNGTTNITNGSVISDNTGRYGGGIYNTGTLNIIDSSVTDNTAPYGGGVDTFGTGTFTSIMVTGNTGSGINNFGL